jgi:hypothetical protein
MKTFTGWEYLLIDLANQFGHDKMVFEDRITWASENMDKLEDLADQAETKPLYMKAMQAVRKAQRGIPSGHMVGLDACCSGIQLMSVLTGCVKGATATGLVNPDERSDAYTYTTQVMSGILGNSVDISRTDAKQSLMTSFYGSKAMPKQIFGEDTPELDAFYQAANEVAPGAWQLLQELLGSWKPWGLIHEWKLPDGFDAKVKVMNKREVRIEVDELDHATFTYEFYENLGARHGLSNAANVVHSMDAFVLREMHRRCNYDRNNIVGVSLGLYMESNRRALVPTALDSTVNPKVAYYIDQYERSTLASAAILPYLDEMSMSALSQKHLEALVTMVAGMLAYQPFPLVTVHDEFKAHPNNLNAVRSQYREILAEIAESMVLDDLLSQVHNKPLVFPKMTYDLADHIRGSNYALS